ncbi:MAG: hypothetical protein H6587_08120 [Flavobacteriales bacterium]|nr:hypothetical protein [Flavobacteriales bacterium]MCB9364519.1 hypothetical protein [Flavobacteriales bacterium]
MNFRTLLENEHSKATTNLIVNEICENPHQMDEFMQTFVAGPIRITQRAAWPLSFIAQKKPPLLVNYFDVFINELHKPNNHNAITRNILRALQFTDIPEKHQGAILNRCFDFLTDVNQPIAIKAFSMTIAYNLSKQYPDIKNELKISIENLIPNGSSGIKSRGNKILKKIK